MREGKANWFILVTIFLLWLYNTGRLDSLYNIVLNPNKTYTPPLSNTPTPAVPEKAKSGGGLFDFGSILKKIIPGGQFLNVGGAK